MPEGFEFYEFSEDASIVFRKRKPCHIRPTERQIVEYAVANLSAVSDYIVEVREKKVVTTVTPRHGFVPWRGATVNSTRLTTFSQDTRPSRGVFSMMLVR